MALVAAFSAPHPFDLSLHLRGHDTAQLSAAVAAQCEQSGLQLAPRVMKGLTDYVTGLPLKHPRVYDDTYTLMFRSTVLLTYEGEPALRCEVFLERPPLQ